MMEALGSRDNVDCGMQGHIRNDILLEDLREVREENRNLKIKIAGVETLSSLLNGTRDELETVSAEKDNLEVELTKLQCRCSMLEKDIAKKQAEHDSSKMSRQSKEMFEKILKENKQLKNELRQAKKSACSESLFSPETMLELLSFKGEVEMEIQNIQKVMKSQEGESQITQISRLLGQVSKLEYQLQSKDDECQILKSEIESLRQTENIAYGPAQSMTVEAGVQTELIADSTGLVLPEGIDKSSVDAHGLNELPLKTKDSSSLKRRNSKRASGDWTNLKRTYSSFFQDDWSVDNINPNEQLKVTQDLLVQANEIIMIMTTENEKLLKVNAKLLQELQMHEEADKHNEKESVIARMKFIFSEMSLDSDMEELGLEACSPITAKDMSKHSRSPGSQEGDKSSDENYISNGDVSEIDTLNKCETTGMIMKKSKHARDSGVDISSLESNKQSSNTQCNTSKSCNQTRNTDINENIASTNDLVEENLKLKTLLESKCEKLTNAENMVEKLQQELSSVKERKAAYGTRNSDRRLCKSVNNISTAVHLPVTYQRIVLESDI